MQIKEMEIQITNREEAENNLKTGLFIGACRTEESGNYLAKESELEGISKYLIIQIRDSESGEQGLVQQGFVRNRDSIKKYLDSLSWNENDAWKLAEENTKKCSQILPINFLLNLNLPETDGMPYVISNTWNFLGAGSALIHETLEGFGRKYHTNRIALLPSSIHEMLIVPNQELLGGDLSNLSNMVKEINHSLVEPNERLTDRAYIIDFN